MKEYIDKWQAVANLMDAGLKDTAKAVDAIQYIPAADVVERKKGRWIEKEYDPEYLIVDFNCSECDYELFEYYTGEGCWPGKTSHYYCPNCGANMRGEADG